MVTEYCVWINICQPRKLLTNFCFSKSQECHWQDWYILLRTTTDFMKEQIALPQELYDPAVKTGPFIVIMWPFLIILFIPTFIPLLCQSVHHYMSNQHQRMGQMKLLYIKPCSWDGEDDCQKKCCMLDVSVYIIYNRTSVHILLGACNFWKQVNLPPTIHFDRSLREFLLSD